MVCVEVLFVVDKYNRFVVIVIIVVMIIICVLIVDCGVIYFK